MPSNTKVKECKPTHKEIFDWYELNEKRIAGVKQN